MSIVSVSKKKNGFHWQTVFSSAKGSLEEPLKRFCFIFPLTATQREFVGNIYI